MGEHDDDLEVAESGAHDDVARIGAVVAAGLERIATALERGLHEVASAIGTATAEPARPRLRR